MSGEVYGAWNLAEDQLTRYLADKTGLKYGKALFIGTKEDLLGKINVAVFGLNGGQNQDHQYQSGTTKWHVVGAFEGVFAERGVATTLASMLHSQAIVPFDNQDGSTPSMPNVLRLYLISHGVVTRERVEIEGDQKWVSRLVVQFGVVYQETGTETPG